MRRRLRQLLAKNRKKRSTPRFAEAKQIGILFNADNQAIEKPLAAFIRRLEKEGKQVTPFTYFEGERRAAFQFAYEAITDREISWLGSIKSEKAHKFMEKNFDFLFCFHAQPSEVTDLLLAGSRAKCRVGFYEKGREPLYELMLVPEQNAPEEHMIPLAFEYVKIICQN